MHRERIGVPGDALLRTVHKDRQRRQRVTAIDRLRSIAEDESTHFKPMRYAAPEERIAISGMQLGMEVIFLTLVNRQRDD